VSVLYVSVNQESWEVGGWGRDPKKCTGRDWGMGSSTIQWNLRPVVNYHLRPGVGFMKFLENASLDPSPPPLRIVDGQSAIIQSLGGDIFFFHRSKIFSFIALPNAWPRGMKDWSNSCRTTNQSLTWEWCGEQHWLQHATCNSITFSQSRRNFVKYGSRSYVRRDCVNVVRVSKSTCNSVTFSQSTCNSVKHCSGVYVSVDLRVIL